MTRKLPPTTGAFAGMAPWTTRDEATLRAAFLAGGLAAASRALPARTEGALYARAARLGLARRPHWTPETDAQMRALWGGDLDLRAIAAQLGRSVASTYWRAKKIGLPVGCPSGWEKMAAACRRTGFHEDTLRRLLEADGATVRMAVTRRRGRQERLHRIVPIAQVDAAVAAWVEEEPVRAAARRAGVNAAALRRRLRALGIPRPGRPGRFWRVTGEQVAAALAIPLRGHAPLTPFGRPQTRSKNRKDAPRARPKVAQTLAVSAE